MWIRSIIIGAYRVNTDKEFKDPAAIRQEDTDEDATSRTVAEGVCLLSCCCCVENKCFVCDPHGTIDIRCQDRITLRRHVDGLTFRAMPGKLVMNFEEKEKGAFEVDMVLKGQNKEFLSMKKTLLYLQMSRKVCGV